MKWKCRYCSQKFDTIAAKKEHIEKFHIVLTNVTAPHISKPIVNRDPRNLSTR